MMSRKNIKIFDFNGVNIAKHWHVAGRGICHHRLPCSPVIISLYLKQIATEMVLMQYCIDVCTMQHTKSRNRFDEGKLVILTLKKSKCENLTLKFNIQECIINCGM